MEEAIKIYRPKSMVMAKTETAVPDYLEDFWCKETKLDTLKMVLREREEKTKALCKERPWYNLLYNWLIAALGIALIFSCIWWGLSVNASNKASAEYTKAMEAFYFEQEAKAQAEEAALLAAQQSEEAMKERDIQLMAKLLAGLNGFIKNRNYTDLDLETYGQCAINRVLNPAFKSMSLREVIMTEDQWVGFSEDNQITASNYKIAKKLVERFYNNEPMPCTYEFCWAEFTSHGLYLKSDFGPATVDNTWRASNDV